MIGDFGAWKIPSEISPINRGRFPERPLPPIDHGFDRFSREDRRKPPTSRGPRPAGSPTEARPVSRGSGRGDVARAWPENAPLPGGGGSAKRDHNEVLFT